MKIYSTRHGQTGFNLDNRICGVSDVYLTYNGLEQAKNLLRQSDLNISQIAASVGYNDVLAFSSFFSKKQGMSPTAYRKEKALREEKNM